MGGLAGRHSLGNMADNPQGNPGPPTTIVLFGATGDLARRKLLPGMIHLWRSGLLPHMQVVGTSLDEHTRESFIELARKAIEEHGDDEEEPQEFDAFAARPFWATDGDENLLARIDRSQTRAVGNVWVSTSSS